MMRPGIWRHENCLDVDFQVFHTSYEGPDYIKVKVNYVSRTGGYFFYGSPDKVTIQRKDLQRWRYMGSAWRADYTQPRSPA